MAGAQHVGAMAEKHTVGCCQGERVTGAFFPGQMSRADHELTILYPRKLGERAIRRLVAPNTLGGREHWVAAITLLVVAVVLVAVHHNFIADLPAFYLRTGRPDDASGVRAGDVIRIFMAVKR